MTHREDIAALTLRIALAEAARDVWQAAGVEEKYLEAYTTVEALELQLAELSAQAHGAEGPPPVAS